MNIKKISPQLFVSEQITSLDVGAVAAQGIKTIMCNRPDDESQGQPAASEIAAAAEGLGITFVDLPVKSGAVSDENVIDFERACTDASAPILAYCRTGLRSISLWALAETSSLDVDAIMSAAGEAGYDLSKLRPRLRERSVVPTERQERANGLESEPVGG